MKMWVDLVVDEIVGVGAEVVSMVCCDGMFHDGSLEEPYPTIYVIVPVFGASHFGESVSDILSPLFYHVLNDFRRIEFVTANTYRHHPEVAVFVVVEAGD